MLIYINKQFSIFKPIVINSILLHLRTSALVQAGQSKNKASISYSIRIITFGGDLWKCLVQNPTQRMPDFRARSGFPSEDEGHTATLGNLS